VTASAIAASINDQDNSGALILFDGAIGACGGAADRLFGNDEDQAC
jgi:hypothetical protein